MLKQFERRIGDLDDVFGFQTTKIVVLKDRFLGLLALALKIAIAVYLIITVFLDKGYYVIEQPRGTSRMTLQMNNWTGSTDYCTNPPTGAGQPLVPGMTLPCAYMSTEDVSVPSYGGTFFVTTRLTLSQLSYTCDRTDYTCIDGKKKAGGYPLETETFNGFVAGIEDATLYLIHTIQGRGEVKIERTLTEMYGEVLDCEGNVAKVMPKKSASVSKYDDLEANRIFSVRQLLVWARTDDGECVDTVDLDEPSLNNPEKEPNNTFRYDGLTMHIIIDYDNTKGSTSDVEYTMSVSVLKKTDPKYQTLRNTATDSVKELDNRHGILIVVVQTGKLGTFSFAALVIAGTAGLGLLAVANTLTDLVAKYVMPLKAEYRKLIFEYSQDFGDFKKQLDTEKQTEMSKDLNQGLLDNKSVHL
ncbi:P2X receptor A [Diplonema papillatum]|nr:P2X receptor A [Diplonema papillatum]